MTRPPPFGVLPLLFLSPIRQNANRPTKRNETSMSDTPNPADRPAVAAVDLLIGVRRHGHDHAAVALAELLAGMGDDDAVSFAVGVASAAVVVAAEWSSIAQRHGANVDEALTLMRLSLDGDGPGPVSA